VPGAEHANLIVVFRTKQMVHRFRPVCSHKERKWLGQRQQQQQQQGVDATSDSADGGDGAHGACATLLGACRHLYRHAFTGGHWQHSLLVTHTSVGFDCLQCGCTVHMLQSEDPPYISS
jgi:hypothetical protein